MDNILLVHYHMRYLGLGLNNRNDIKVVQMAVFRPLFSVDLRNGRYIVKVLNRAVILELF